MRVAYLAAGAANMFCGSCLRDNALARELIRLDCETLLIPTYTPIRTDEEDSSLDVVFLGGINMYLQQKYPIFRYLPRWMDRWLDRPGLLRWVSSRAIRTDGRDLADLAVSVLQGEHGHQRKEFQRLLEFIKHDIKPDLVNLSNLLIGGIVPMIKRELKVPVVVTLQGDDLFINDLPEPQRSKALAEIRKLDEHVDGYITFSKYYADYMTDLLGLHPGRFYYVPLGLGVEYFANSTSATVGRSADAAPVVGFLARICPAKGFHVLVDAVTRLKKMPGTENTRLHVAGWLGANDQQYYQDHLQQIRAAGWESDFHYAGVVDRETKASFLRSLDVMSVPTTYREPKGLSILEALASGVPVVVPEHGAFPEMLAATGGGRLVRPNDPQHLAETLHELLQNPAMREKLAAQGQAYVQRHHAASHMASKTLDTYRSLLASHDTVTESPATASVASD